MHPHDRWDSLIQFWCDVVWPAQDWRLIKAQAVVESDMDPRAVSGAGAQGLLQLMPRTAKELRCEDPHDPEQNLRAGITYLRWQHDHFSEIPIERERIQFALAAYNCGRGYINKAIRIYYEEEFSESMPSGHEGARPGRWQLWEQCAVALAYRRCTVRGRRCRHKEVWGYVRRIMALHTRYRLAGDEPVDVFSSRERCPHDTDPERCGLCQREAASLSLTDDS